MEYFADKEPTRVGLKSKTRPWHLMTTKVKMSSLEMLNSWMRSVSRVLLHQEFLKMNARRSSRQELLGQRARYMTLEPYQGTMKIRYGKVFGTFELSK